MSQYSFIRPYFKRMRRDGAFHSRAQNGYLPDVVAGLYSFPQVKLASAPYVALIELGGGFNQANINKWCDQNGNLPHPNLVAVSVDGATNSWTGDSNSADVEVELDICCVIGAIYKMTGLAANILVFFAPNTDSGFANAVSAAGKHPSKPLGCGISWGGPESQWSISSIVTFNNAIQSGTLMTTCCAAGDSGSSDGVAGVNVDFPGSSPYAVCAGGTTIKTAMVNNVLTITNEVPWNAGGGATGGGYSAKFPVPAWQTGFVPTGKGRGVPDISMTADPASGYITTFGVIGGTSAVAPMLAAYFAVVNAVTGKTFKPGDAYPFESTFRDIVTGNNGDFSATKGWDPASGLGAIVGDKLLSALQSGTPTPVPTPVPVPIPTPTPTPIPVPPIQPASLTESQIDAILDAECARIARNNWMLRSIMPLIDNDLKNVFHQKFASMITVSEHISFGTILGLFFKYGPVIWQVVQDIRTGKTATQIIAEVGPVAIEILTDLGIQIPTGIPIPPVSNPTPPPASHANVSIGTIWNLIVKDGPAFWQVLLDVRSGKPIGQIIAEVGPIAIDILAALGIQIPAGTVLPVKNLKTAWQ